MEQVVETYTTVELLDRAAILGAAIAAAHGSLLEVVGELIRREGFREEGATSMTAWLTERCGIAESTARVLAQVAEKLWDLPHLAEGLRDGLVSLDKVRLAVDYATPETDAEVLAQITECTWRQVHEVAKAKQQTKKPGKPDPHQSRYLRFNDDKRTVSAQLPEDHYAQVKGTLDGLARSLESDGEVSYDQRLADALVMLCTPGRVAGTGGTGGSGRAHVVVHADLAILRGGTGVAELEHLGLLSPEAARRLMCEAEVALAIDDAFGHTMYEGRAVRLATEAQRREVQRRDRHCRFPGCGNDTFTQVHHLVQWIAGGRTDIDNLALLCDHHHHRVHESKWQVSGNANGVLTFVGPTKRPMTSRPSPLWTRRT